MLKQARQILKKILKKPSYKHVQFGTPTTWFTMTTLSGLQKKKLIFSIFKLKTPDILKKKKQNQKKKWVP